MQGGFQSPRKIGHIDVIVKAWNLQINELINIFSSELSFWVV